MSFMEVQWGHIQRRRNKKMTAMNFASNNQSFTCSTTAAACSAARIIDRMDTAIIMVVSIIVRLISVLVRKDCA